MKRSTRMIILAFSGLTLILAVLSAVFGWPLALGAAAVAGGCAVWAALMSTSGPEPACAPGPAPVALASDVAAAPPTPVSPSSDPSVVVVVQPAQATPECAEPAAVKSDVMAAVQAPTPESATQAVATNPEPRQPQPAIVMPISAEPCEVAQALLVNSAGAGDAVSACLWLADVGTPTLRLVCAVGDAPEERTPIPVDEGILGESLASGENRCERIGCSAEDGGTRGGWRYAIPIADGEPSGVAVVNFRGDREPDLFALETLTQSLRGVFAGSLALHVSRAEAASARELIETVSDLSRLLDPEEVIDATLAHALTVSGADTASVMLVDGNSTVMHIARAHGLPEDVVRDTVVSEGEGIAGWVLASGRPLVVEDLEHLGPQSRRHGILSAASVPIADEDGVLGVLNVGSRSFHARFSRSHVRAVEAVGRSAALALRNARAAQSSQDLFFDSLKALALALETRDPYSHGGTSRVVSLAVALGERLDLGEDDARALRLASLLHDIGMSAAGEAAAGVSRPLTTVEWGMLKMHPRIATEVLAQAPALQAVIPIVFHHHEHFDGTGYLGWRRRENRSRSAHVSSRLPTPTSR